QELTPPPGPAAASSAGAACAAVVGACGGRRLAARGQPLAAPGQPLMKCATAARRSDSETLSPTSPSPRVTAPDGLSNLVGGVPPTASAPSMPSSAGPLRSDTSAGGVFQAIQGRRRRLDGDSSRLFIA